MINLIGNSCFSSYIKRDFLKEEFINPFVWCSVTETDILNVIKFYEEINWFNYSIYLYKNKTFNIQNVKIIVDNLFTIKFPHYALSNCETKIDGVNVFSKNIIQFAEEKYNNRCKKLLKYNITPTYLLGGTWEDQIIYNEKDFLKFKNIIIVNNPQIVHDNYKLAYWFWENKNQFKFNIEPK